MTRLRTSAALLALGLAVSGCSPADQGLAPGAYNPSLSSVNQPVVQRTDYVLDLASGDGIGGAERDRLSAWFQTLRLGYGDRIYVEDGADYGDGRARQDIAAMAAGYGLLLSDGAPITAGSVQPGSVRVIVSRSTASVPGCPIWEDPQINAINSTPTNFGCAVNSNLASMIADPNDLVLGQTGSDEADGATAAKAIKLYRETAPTGAKGLSSTVTRGGK